MDDDDLLCELCDPPLSSVIANEFTEADKTVYLSALIELGLALFLVTVIINITGKKIIDRITNS